MEEKIGRCCVDIVCEGCLVLLFIDRRRKFVFRVRKGDVQGSDKGILRHDDIIGLPYGSKVRLSTGIEAIIHKPMLVDFLDHFFVRKTQVIYPKDHGLMLVYGGIGPGSRVVEIGVGSGFTTTVLAWIVGSEGKVYAYEVREDLLELAKRNLESAGLLDRVIFKLRDAREGIDETDVDAIVVDMPDPWNTLNHVHRALRGSGSLIVFMPSVNQVVRMVTALTLHGGFSDIRVFEALVREYQALPDALRPYTTGVVHTGYLLFARKVQV